MKDLSSTIEPGEAFGFLGPNGAGKTTTITILGGLLLPTGGSAQVYDHEVGGSASRPSS